MSGLLFSALILLAAPPSAEEWAGSFPVSNTSAYLPPSSDVVVIAGRSGPQTVAAASAVADAFQKGGRAKSVRTGETLGDVSKLDDAAIVQKCISLPVTVIAIVRVFSSNDGLRAIVTLLRKSGAEFAALTTLKGKPVRPPEKSATGEGVSAGAAESILSVAELGSAGAGSTEGKYLERFVWFGEVLDGSDIRLKGIQPLQGKYRKRLSWSRFYGEVGRQDLKASYRRNRLVRGSIMLGGVGAIAAAIAAPLGDDNSLRAGIGIAGVVGIGGAYLWDPQPIRFSEARRLADEHNARVKQELGLSRLVREPRVRIAIAPDASGKASVVLSTTF